MANDKAAPATPAIAPPASGASKSATTLALVNTVVVMAGLGFLGYTKLLYKRPSITEQGERLKIEAIKASPTPPATPGFISFDPTIVNIASNPENPKAADNTSTQLQGKLHYAQIGFSLELTDITRKEEIESLRPLIMDRFLGMVGKKKFEELTNVQGRYLLRTQLLESANQLIVQRSPGHERDPLVTNVYFTQFLVQ